MGYDYGMLAAPRTIKDIRKAAYRFVSRDLAMQSINGTAKPMRVMLGDDGRYWIVTPAHAARMDEMGYEYAI